MDNKFKELASLRAWIFNFRCKLEKLPHKPGVYVITFKNQKRYIGSTNNLYRRIVSHLGCLCGRNHDTTKWYKLAREENQLPKYVAPPEKKKRKQKNDDIFKEMREQQEKYFKFLRQSIMNEITISYCICDDYGEYEDALLKAIEDRDMWYNTQFYGNNKKEVN